MREGQAYIISLMTVLSRAVRMLVQIESSLLQFVASHFFKMLYGRKISKYVFFKKASLGIRIEYFDESEQKLILSK